MPFINELSGQLKRYFISGILVVVPLILTYTVLKFLFESIDGILQPLINKLLGYYIPGLGLFSTLLVIILAGVLTRNLIGHRIYSIGDKLLVKMPIIRPVYSSAKQLLSAITEPSVASFKETALIEYPRKGLFAICFISKRLTIKNDNDDNKYVVVFVPSTPTPFSGMAIVVPESEIFPLTMSVEEGIKFLVSGGVVSPEMLEYKKNDNNEVNGETR